MVDDTNVMTQTLKNSTFQLLLNLRISNAIVPSSLVLLGLFWNNMAGFDLGYVFLIFSIFFGNVFAFVVNDFYDVSADIEDPVKKMRNVFCSNETRNPGMQALYSSLILSLIFGALTSFNVLIIVGLLNLVFFFYSAPPVRLRDRMFWDWIFVILWKGLIILACYVYIFGMTEFRGDTFIYGTLLIIFVLTLIGQIRVNQLTDFEVDKQTNKTNTVQILGRQRSILIYKILFVIFFATGFFLCWVFQLYFAMSLILINLTLYYFVRPSKRHYILDYSLIWVVVLFVEKYWAIFNFYVLLLFGTWVVVMFGLAVFHTKRKGLI